jgi:hypothetical protein
LIEINLDGGSGMQIRLTMLLAVLALASAGVYAADSADDVVAMAQKGVGEEVLLAAVENSKTGFNLTTADIIKMKESKVPDRVVAAMIRHRPGAKAEAAAPKVAAAPLAPRAADGVLNIENLDDKTWSYMYEPDAQTIWISRGTTNGRGNLEPHGGLSLRMPAGTYSVRYNGRDNGQNVTVHADDKSLLMLTRVETAQLEALYVTVFEKGERKSGGRLVTLRENPAPKKGAYNDDLDSQPAERVVERERVVEVPSTTVVYREPSVVYSSYAYPSYYPSYSRSYVYGGYYGGGYYSGSYCSPRHYSSYRSPSYYGGYRYGNYCSPRYGSSFGFGYNSGYRSGHRSGVSVGIGVRF